MSFKKIQKIDPSLVNNPESGFMYLGYSDTGLWEKTETGQVSYIQSGNTYINIITGSTSSGTSGVVGTSGTSGTDGGIGTSGTAGKSGKDGTSGSSGNGTSGTSGITGTSGTSSTSGTSGKTGSSGTGGSSGTDGGGSSGTSGSSGSSGENGSSGTSGIDGAYGGSTRRWVLDLSSSVPVDGKVYISAISDRLDMLNYIRVNKKDADGNTLTGWLDTWGVGLLNVEDRRNLSTFGLYSLTTGSTISKIGNFYEINGVTILSASNISLIDGSEILISFDYSSGGISGTYSFDGSVVGTVSSMTITNGIITSISVR